VEANSTGGQGSRRAVAPSDDDDDILIFTLLVNGETKGSGQNSSRCSLSFY
jgi:hypothetical protein